MSRRLADTKILQKKLKPKTEWLELEPFGMTTGMTEDRPVMLFREKGGEAVLPVWLSPLEAGIVLTQHNSLALSPHDISLRLLKDLGVELDSCHFTEVKGHQQFAELHLKGVNKIKVIKARADHAVSFCIHAKVKFQCTRDFLNQCREVQAEMKQPQVLTKVKGGVLRGRQQYLN